MRFKLESIVPPVDGVGEDSVIKVEGSTAKASLITLGNGDASSFINLDMGEVRVAYLLLGKVLEFSGGMEDL